MKTIGRIFPLILFILAIGGCTKPETIYKVEPDLNPYLQKFYDIASTYGRQWNRGNLIMKLTTGLSKSQNVIGLTTKIQDGQMTIEFDQDFWLNSSESIKEVLMYHECGHAFLNRIHTQTYSIMNIKYGATGWPICYNQECDHKFLLDELFKPQ